MVRSTDLETIAIEKIVCYSYQKEGAGHAGSTRASQEVEGSRRKHGREFFCGFHGKELVR